MTSPEELQDLAGAALSARTGPGWREQTARKSFVELGGDSLSAASLVAQAEGRLGLTVDLGELLSPAPLADVLLAAVPVPSPAASGDRDAHAGDGLRPTLPGQDNMLLTTQYTGGTSLHMVLSAEIAGPLDEAVLLEALNRLSARHDTLRTVFTATPDGFRRRILAAWRPTLVRQCVQAPQGTDPVELVHQQLGATSAQFVPTLDRPPYTYVLSELAEDRHLLSFVHHASLIDGWGIGMLWRELVELYDALRHGRAAEEPPTLSAEIVREREERVAGSVEVQQLRDRRIAQLAGLPKVLDMPSDLVRPEVFDFRGERLCFELTDTERDTCEKLASHAGVTKTVVLFAAWSLALGRRAGVSELIMGTAAARRSNPDIRRTMGSCAVLIPVGVRMDDTLPVAEYLRRTSRHLADAVAAMHVPFGDLVAGLGGMPEKSRVPLVQVAFSGQHDFIPYQLRTAELEITTHQGHCRGASLDLALYVQRWGERPRMAMEYATSAFSPVDAAELVESFRGVLAEMADVPDAPLSSIRGVTARQLRRLVELGTGAEVDSEQGLWQLFARSAAEHPGLVAVDDPAGGTTLTYGRLLEAATAQSAALASAGVRAGDHVVVALPRSAAEIVAVLGVLRLGAAFVSLSPSYPENVTGDLLRLCAPTAVIGSDERARELASAAPGGCALVAPVDPGAPAGPAGAPAPADPGRIAYLSFTSGSTGTPKAVRIPHRAVARLALDPDAWSTGPGDRFLRLAPLSFDASTLELFVPLMAGSTTVVFPEGPVAAATLADFLGSRSVNVMWLTAGLFRLVAEHQPLAFASARQVMTGGDVVPVDQVRSLLSRYPHLRISNGYGPTENTSLTTIHHVDDACGIDEPLPIGKPVAGTRVQVLDGNGRLVPPGGIGELYAGGAGLATDYFGDEERTRQAFADDAAGGGRLYRTGDVVRWDNRGRLRFLGRRDQQVKIRGFRVELDAVRARLTGHPSVRDAVAVAVGDTAENRRILAAVIPAEDAPSVAALRQFAADALPAYAVPAWWAVVGEFPVTANGKIDTAALRELALDTADD
ncbi:amino acid adenylation domain-containing protein [Streptomyces nondiastaticus]|uniref:non-ribosomal peptide synthetase n=1 Tax=Streptomyces nondiastaticus TaxID=3154512 RepID=UPI0034402B62